jgi:hypothetical protein
MAAGGHALAEWPRQRAGGTGETAGEQDGGRLCHSCRPCGRLGRSPLSTLYFLLLSCPTSNKKGCRLAAFLVAGRGDCTQFERQNNAALEITAISLEIESQQIRSSLSGRS